MLFQLSLPDDVYTKYAAYDKESPRKAMEAQLTRFQNVSPIQRVLQIDPPGLARIEKALGYTIEDPVELVEAVEKMSQVDLGDVKVTLTESQRKRLVAESAHYKENASVYLSRRLTHYITKVVGW